MEIATGVAPAFCSKPVISFYRSLRASISTREQAHKWWPQRQQCHINYIPSVIVSHRHTWKGMRTIQLFREDLRSVREARSCTVLNFTFQRDSTDPLRNTTTRCISRIGSSRTYSRSQHVSAVVDVMNIVIRFKVSIPRASLLDPPSLSTEIILFEQESSRYGGSVISSTTIDCGQVIIGDEIRKRYK